MVKHVTPAVALFLVISNSAAAGIIWNNYVTPDGKTSVKWKVVKGKNGFPVIEYFTHATAKVELKNLVSTFKKIENHKIINDEMESKIIKTISNNQWLVYYSHDDPWPIKDSETVSKVTLIEYKSTKTAVFTTHSDPDYPLPPKDTLRVTFINVTYTFHELDNGHCEISIHSMSLSPIDVPDWMINTWFPKGPIDIMHRLIALAGKP